MVSGSEPDHGSRLTSLEPALKLSSPLDMLNHEVVRSWVTT